VEKDGRFGELRKEKEMAIITKSATGKDTVTKLTLKNKKGIIRDLDATRKGKDIKGGAVMVEYSTLQTALAIFGIELTQPKK
jgi:hypothetical protein